MLDKIVRLINKIIDWFTPKEYYYKPYESNILGEHRRSSDHEQNY